MPRYHALLTTAMTLAATCACNAQPVQVGLPLPSAGQSTTSALSLTVADVKGSYTIPYIQSAPELVVAVQFAEAGPRTARVELVSGGEVLAQAIASPGAPQVRFSALPPAEYALRITSLDANGQNPGTAVWERAAVGTVIAAIGDSITEGYHGHGFMRADIDLTADAFPSETVSNDGRNYPQYAPTTSYHRPDVNCFQSWMTDLNNLLSDRWHQPVFIANEGWGGITSDGYRRMMREDKGWQARMDLLRPSVWLIHLGVNDERAHVPAAEYAKNMGAIVDLLITRYGAAPDRILVCRPCYDYFEGAPEILQTYIAANDQLVAERGLRPGPDFFSAYSVDKDKWYGADPVHPNTEGMQYMAKLWAEAILSALPNGATR